jgi:uncharacterized membrane protein (DUF2068 family)
MGLRRRADPLSGRRPHRPVLLRVIAAERAIRGALLIAAGAYLFGHLHSDFGRLADRWMRKLELDPNRHFLHRIVEHLHNVTTNEVKIFAVLALGYGVLELVEGVGLWLDKLWAEFLTVIATSLLVPLEIYELVRKPGPVKAAGIVVNVLIVLYLAHRLRQRLAHHHRH